MDFIASVITRGTQVHRGRVLKTSPVAEILQADARAASLARGCRTGHNQSPEAKGGEQAWPRLSGAASRHRRPPTAPPAGTPRTSSSAACPAAGSTQPSPCSAQTQVSMFCIPRHPCVRDGNPNSYISPGAGARHATTHCSFSDAATLKGQPKNSPAPTCTLRVLIWRTAGLCTDPSLPRDGGGDGAGGGGGAPGGGR